jgi:hypothetical protein
MLNKYRVLLHVFQDYRFAQTHFGSWYADFVLLMDIMLTTGVVRVNVMVWDLHSMYVLNCVNLF